MIAFIDTSAYTVVFPKFAIIVLSIWLAIVIGIHIFVFANIKKQHTHRPSAH